MRVLLLAAASWFLLTGAVCAQSSETTKGRLDTQAGGVVWKPVCEEPRRPARNTTFAAAAYNRAVTEYFTCVTSQADYDVAVIQRSVEKGREEAVQQMRDRLRRNQ
ncbi:hypothetical protein P7B02_06460 [Caulobacter segnis]|uniref:hypothetical protein n=1 Tax=Caulobacter segnis TaxID=88688 RepID=UPI00240F11EF|nr:hypothetical protein [Caulobacter segnis]MDG2521180.1 hypothetical protein [Caulobacter segnis]